MTTAPTFTLRQRGDRRTTTRTVAEFRYMTLADFNALPTSPFYGGGPDLGTFYVEDSRGTAANVRQSGKVKRWKRDANRIEFPAKFGMYESMTFYYEAAHDYFRAGSAIALVRVSDWRDEKITK